MTAVGFAYFGPALLSIPREPLPFTVSLVLWGLPMAFAAHLFVVFPAGRTSPSLERRLIASAYLLAVSISPLGMTAWLASALVPLAFLDGLLRTRLQQGGIAQLVVELGAAPPAGRIRELLARTLDDRSVQLAFWRPDAGGHVDAAGAPLVLPEDGGGRVASIIEDRGAPVAALIHDRSLLENPRLLQGASAAARLPWRPRLQAELRAQLREVRASRGRIVEAGDAERRRIERNLHDGAQQRLLAIRLALRLARKHAGDVEPQLAEIDSELGGALEELRTLARGLHPPILTEQGLGPALETLRRRAAIPVEIAALPSSRLPLPVETAAYYVVSEGLANAVKHADASHLRVEITQADGRAVVEVADDGRGGAYAYGSGLRALRDRVEALDGVYWKPVWAVLEDRFECLPVNARHIKQVPGRKTDVLDAQWLCQLLEAGLLRASLVPPKPVRTLRNLTRYRKSQIRDRQREMNRLHPVMQDTAIKLDSVATDMLGKSGRAMLDALVSGTTDPVVLTDLARGLLRKRLPALRAALEGRFDSEHALVVGRILAHIDYLDEAIDDLSAAIEEQLGPFAPAVELLCTIPGVGRRAAEVIIAETGGDMSAFPLAKHLASWAGTCPGNDESAGNAARARRARAPNGSARRWSSAPRAPTAAKTPTSPPNARACARRSANKATIAVCHSILTAVWHLSRPARPTPTRAATSSPAATPNAPANASSPSSNDSATPSPCKKEPRQPERDFLYSRSAEPEPAAAQDDVVTPDTAWRSHHVGAVQPVRRLRARLPRPRPRPRGPPPARLLPDGARRRRRLQPVGLRRPPHASGPWPAVLVRPRRPRHRRLRRRGRAHARRHPRGRRGDPRPTATELLAEPELSVLAFRRHGSGLSDYARWADDLRAAGTAFVLPTTVGGEAVARLAIINPARPATTSGWSSTPWADASRGSPAKR
jgi:transposase